MVLFLLQFNVCRYILTLQYFQPTISGGRVEYADSALVRAVRNGRVLVVDEADKAPTTVTSVLRTLLDTGSMWLSGGQIFFFSRLKNSC